MPLSIATFNTKDLFTRAHPMWSSAVLTPDAARVAYDAKLAWTADMIARIDADVVMLQEVGEAEVLDDLRARLPPAFRDAYGAPILGTPDVRGIRCALVARAPVLFARVLTADHLAFPAFTTDDPPPFGARIPLRRGVVHARIDAPGFGPIDFLVAHFKSKRAVPLRDAKGDIVPPVTSSDFAAGELRSLVWRAAEALFVRGAVDALLEEDPARHVVVGGDLNDESASTIVRILQGGGARALERAADAAPEAQRFSILRRGAPQQIDHILVTRALGESLRSARFFHESLRDHGELADDAAPSHDSDHAPLVVSFA